MHTGYIRPYGRQFFPEEEKHYMKRKTLLFLTISLLILFVGACATAPEDDVTVPEVDDAAQAEAAELRAIITEYNLDEYEPAETESGDAQFSAGTANLVDNPEAAGENFRAAIQHFQTVIDRGFPALLSDREAAAETAREEALDARADVAAENLFAQAQTTLQEANTQRSDGSWEASFASFNQALTQFASARDTAVERREAARAALDRATQRLEESEARARELEDEVDTE